jgi:two-component system sensor histidine kinase/response regulator
MDRLMGKISRHFIDQDLDTAINFALEKVGENAIAHRSYIIHYSHDLTQFQITHEWCTPGIAPLKPDFQQHSVEPHSWLHQQLLNGNILQIDRIADLPPNTVTQKAQLEYLSIQSLLHVPIIHSHQLVGCIGLHTIHTPKIWTKEDIKLLQLVGEIIAISQARHQAEIALQQALHAAEAASRAKTEFLSKMSHELRTPLNAILGFSQVMVRDNSLTREQREHLGIINRSGEHLLALINDILSMAKIEAGQATLNETCFDLYQTLSAIEEMLRLKASSKGLQFKIERTPDVPQYIQSDEVKLRQVLINLLGNAVKFTQEGSVSLKVSRGVPAEQLSITNDRFHPPRAVQPTTVFMPVGLYNQQPTIITFEIEDTGPGIDAMELDLLFKPFMQTQTGRQSMKGTGLGLTISRQFIKLMGGDITLASTLGKGTIFTFDIQVSLATTTESQTPSQQRVIGLAPNQPNYRILIVEDILENRQLLVELLESVGFEVCEAVNGEEGIALWQSWQPHLIFMDIFMPVIDGYEATKQIRQLSRDNPNQSQYPIIIALTAGAFEEQRDTILSAGCDDFIHKPFREEILWQKIAEYLELKYLYEEDLQPTSCQILPPTLALTPENLQVMPREWVKQFHQAALCLDDQMLMELIQQIPPHQEPLANALTDLVRNFCLDIIIDLVS